MRRFSRVGLFVGAAQLAMFAATGAWAQASADTPQSGPAVTPDAPAMANPPPVQPPPPVTTPPTPATPAAGASTLAGPQASQLGEVVVTARRIGENLQNVPTAVTAFTATELANRQTLGFGSIANDVPNVNIQSQFGEPATPFITIRGFSNGSLNSSVDNPIGLYIDDVYVGRAVGAAFDLADINQLDVLRGPQGTLFGRNATGGAIDFHTRQPTGQLDAHVEASFGNYDLYRVKATVDTPDFNGLSARLTVLHTSNDGYVKNSLGGTQTVLPQPFGTITAADRLGDDDETGAALAVHYKGVPRLTLDYRLDYTHQIESQLAEQALGFSSTEQFEQGFAAYSGVPSSLTRQSTLPLNFQSDGQLDVFGNSLTAQYELTPGITVKDILAYRSLREETGGNQIDGGPYNGGYLGAPGLTFFVLDSTAHRAQHQWTNEFQVIGHEGRFDWIVGAFFFDERASQNDPVFIFTPTLPSTLAAAIAAGSTITPAGSVGAYYAGELDTADNQSAAGYAHATAHVTDQVDISGGVRYTADYKSYTHLASNSTLTNPTFDKIDANFSNPDFDVSATYKFTPRINVYGKVSTGYLAGGTLGNVTFQPETNTSYEAGLKSEFFERKLRVNVAAFYEHVNNYQFTIFSPSEGGTFIVNGQQTHIPGIEAEITAVPIEGLKLTGTVGHQRTPTLEPPVIAGLAREPLLPLYPATNASLSADYSTRPIFREAYLTFRTEADYTSGHNNAANPVGFPDPTASDMALQEGIAAPAEWTVNSRLTLNAVRFGPTRAKVSVWVNNFLDNRNVNFARDVGSLVVGNFEIPRTFGADIAFDF